MTPGLVAEWSTGSIQLRNIYGVTEATVYQTAMVMSPKTSPQIAGRPLPGRQIDGFLHALCSKALIY